jgi:hypothetical protein
VTEVKTIALFNDAGRVGKTTLAYHLAHMLARLGYPVMAADLDPQANLTSAFFDEERMERLWEGEGSTILTAVDPPGVPVTSSSSPIPDRRPAVAASGEPGPRPLRGWAVGGMAQVLHRRRGLAAADVGLPPGHAPRRR